MAEEKKIATGYIGNALRSSAADHTTTFADEIFDTERQQYQNEVNDIVGTYTENPEFLYVKKDADDRLIWWIYKDGSVDWAKGVPTPIQKELKKLEQLIKDNTEGDESVVARVTANESAIVAINKALEDYKVEVTEALNKKVDGEYIDSPEFISIKTDADDKIIDTITGDGVEHHYLHHVFDNNLDAPVINELKNDLGRKQDSVEGKSLIDADIAEALEVISSPEYANITLDTEGKKVEAITRNGEKEFFIPISAPKSNIGGNDLYTIDSKEFSLLVLDKNDNILYGIKKDGEDTKALDYDKNIIDNEIILPSKVYTSVGKNNNLYHKQFVNHINLNYVLNLSSTSIFTAYKRQIYSNPATAVEGNLTIMTKAYNGNVFSKKDVIVKSVLPNKTGTLKIFVSGSSFTDGGWYVKKLKSMCAERSIVLDSIGTMISLSGDIVECLSGGTAEYLGTKWTDNAVVLSVSGISELPETHYQGTFYEDSEQGVWVVRGISLKKDTNNKYNGKIVLGNFKGDVNQAGGSVNKHGNAATMATSGTITKIKSPNGVMYNGDASITYTDKEIINFNPIWNMETNSIDFAYYFDRWNLGTPDIFIFQGGFNASLSKRTYYDIALVKSIIDKFHEQFPDAYVVYIIDAYGTETDAYRGQADSPRNIGSKYGILEYAKKFISVFDTSEYNFVRIMPAYAWADSENGYGEIIEKQLSDTYPNVNTRVLSASCDGIHSPEGYKNDDIAYGLYPIICEIANNKL